MAEESLAAPSADPKPQADMPDEGERRRAQDRERQRAYRLRQKAARSADDKPAGLGDADEQPQWPERGLTMPDTEEYIVVANDRLNALAEARLSYLFEGLLCCIGLAGGTLASTLVAMSDWITRGEELDPLGFWNSVVFAGALTGCGIFGTLAWMKRKQFPKLLDAIKKGKRYVIEPTARIVPVQSTPQRNGDKAAS